MEINELNMALQLKANLLRYSLHLQVPVAHKEKTKGRTKPLMAGYKFMI